MAAAACYGSVSFPLPKLAGPSGPKNKKNRTAEPSGKKEGESESPHFSGVS
jgi:hypothetical protein